MRYTVLIHPEDGDRIGELKLPPDATQHEFDFYSWDKYYAMKAMIAPDATDEEFWPKGTAYMVPHQRETQWQFMPGNPVK